MKLVWLLCVLLGERSSRSVLIRVFVFWRLRLRPSRPELLLPAAAKGSSSSSSGDEESSSRMRFFPRAFSLSSEDRAVSGSSAPSEALALPAALVVAVDGGDGDGVGSELSAGSSMRRVSADTSATASESGRGTEDDCGGDARSAVSVAACGSVRGAGSSVVYAGGNMYGGGGGGATRRRKGLMDRLEFHIGSGWTEKGRSRCKTREEPGMTANPSPVN